MDPATIIAAVGMAANIGSMFFGDGDENRQKQQQAMDRAYQAQIQAEQVRKQAMEFDALRRKREEVRKAVTARSYALAIGTAKGGVHGSELEGAYGGISGRIGDNLRGIEGNRELGGKIFDLNMQATQAQREAAMYGSEAKESDSFWQSLGSVGGSVANNSDKLAKIGSYMRLF
jgi:hypothetical protein